MRRSRSIARALPLTLLVSLLAALLVGGLGCRKETPRPTTRGARSSVALDGLAAARATMKTDALGRVDELVKSLDDLQNALGGRDFAKAELAYREVRRRERDLSPTVRALAPLASAGLGGYATDKEDGAAGFRPLHAALFASPTDFARASERTASARRAAVSLHAELSSATWSSAQVGYALSDGAYVFGARLDGSDAPDEPTRIRDLRAEGGGLLRQIVVVRDAIRGRDPSTADALDEDALVLSSFLKSIDRLELAPTPVVRGTAAMARATGALGLHFRKAFGPSAEARIPPPYVAAHGEEAVSVGTFPRPRFAPDKANEALGQAIFSSPLLSDEGRVTCATCHAPEHAFAQRGARPRGADGKPTAREPLSLLGVGHEVAFFWDGRAGSLGDQLDTVITRDLHTTWPALLGRLAKDETMASSFQRITGQPPSEASTKAALVAYQRSLVADDLPIDRYFRGRDDALSAEALFGFDLYFGKARCSRCHRLPLTSGVAGPRFLEAEFASIGVPKTRGGKVRDADEGRGAITGNAEDRATFRTPTLRQITKTAPYFHNGSYATLEHVVEFYERGAGHAVDAATPNLDPDLAAFSLRDEERSALLAFLREGLATR